MELNQNLQFDEAIKLLEEKKSKLEKILFAQKKLEEIIPINLDCNLQALKQYFPNIYEKFNQYKLKNNYKLTCNENGEPNILLQEGKYFYGESPFQDCKQQITFFLENKKNNTQSLCCDYENNPYNQLHFYYKNRIYAEATKIKNESDLNKNVTRHFESTPLMIMYGIGLGFQLSYLYENFTPINLYIIEPDEDLFYLSLCVFDYSTLFGYIHERNLGLKFVFSDDPDYILNDLDKYTVRYGMNLAQKSFLIHYSSEQIKKINDRIMQQLPAIAIKAGFFDDLLIGMCHSYRNILNGIKLLSTQKISDKFSSIPLLVVGNGPSLDTELEFIKKINKKVCILASGTALTSLSNYGIKVDIAVEIERVDDIYNALLTIKDQSVFENVLFIGPDVVSPKVINKYKNRIIGLKLNETMPTAIKQLPHFTNADNCVELSYINPLVSNMGLSVATSLGFKEIYLVGVDNGSAYKEGHSVFSCYYDDNHKLKEEFKNMPLDNFPLTHPGNFRDTINTNGEFKMSILVMEQLISKNKHKYTYYNASDGARITGATPKHLSDINWENYKDFNHEELRDYIVNNMTETLNINQDDFDLILKTKRYNDVADTLIHDLNNLPQQRDEIVLRLETHFDYLTDLIKEASLSCRNALHGSLHLLYAGYLSALYSISDQDEAIQKCKPLIHLIIEFIEKTKKYYSHAYEFDYDYINEHIMPEEEKEDERIRNYGNE